MKFMSTKGLYIIQVNKIIFQQNKSFNERICYTDKDNNKWLIAKSKNSRQFVDLFDEKVYVCDKMPSEGKEYVFNAYPLSNIQKIITLKEISNLLSYLTFCTVNEECNVKTLKL